MILLIFDLEWSLYQSYKNPPPTAGITKRKGLGLENMGTGSEEHGKEVAYILNNIYSMEGFLHKTLLYFYALLLMEIVTG